MSVKEIAQAMETTEGTVKSRLNYARKSIKAGVEDLEKRGTKLYSIAPLPLLLLLFLRKDASQSGMTAAQSAQVSAAVLSAIAAVGIVFGATQLMKPESPPQVEDEPPAQSEQQTGLEQEPEDEGLSPELLALLDSIVYYGDKSQCKLTGEQAAAYAQVLRQESDSLLAEAKWKLLGQNPQVGTYAALFDVGDGTPALFFGGGAILDFSDTGIDGDTIEWSDVGTVGIWQYLDGQAVPYAPDGLEPGVRWGQVLALRDGTLYTGGVYPLTGGTIPTQPQTSAGYEPKDYFENPYDSKYNVDGVETSRETFEAWQDQWERQSDLCSHYWGGGMDGSFTGLGDAGATAEALTQYAAQTIAAGSGGVTLPWTAPKPYAQKVRELMAYNPNLTFDLVYIDGDDIPELLIDHEEVDINWISFYTFAGDSLYTLTEDLTVGIRDYLGYYPKENLVEYSGADLNMNQWESTETYYRISETHQWEQSSAPDGISTEMQYPRGAMTGAEILAQLDP